MRRISTGPSLVGRLQTRPQDVSRYQATFSVPDASRSTPWGASGTDLGLASTGTLAARGVVDALPQLAIPALDGNLPALRLKGLGRGLGRSSDVGIRGGVLVEGEKYT
jgi:hypothetical protein